MAGGVAYTIASSSESKRPDAAASSNPGACRTVSMSRPYRERSVVGRADAGECRPLPGSQPGADRGPQASRLTASKGHRNRVFPDKSARKEPR
jgi:hypothetical protein